MEQHGLAHHSEVLDGSCSGKVFVVNWPLRGMVVDRNFGDEILQNVVLLFRFIVIISINILVIFVMLGCSF